MKAEEEQEPGKKFYKDRGFQLGCVGWFVVNALVFAILQGLAAVAPPDGGTLAAAIPVLLLIANIIALIYFALRRPTIAGGMVAAFGISLAVVIVAGIVFTIACFALLQNY